MRSKYSSSINKIPLRQLLFLTKSILRFIPKNFTIPHQQMKAPESIKTTLNESKEFLDPWYTMRTLLNIPFYRLLTRFQPKKQSHGQAITAQKTPEATRSLLQSHHDDKAGYKARTASMSAKTLACQHPFCHLLSAFLLTHFLVSELLGTFYALLAEYPVTDLRQIDPFIPTMIQEKGLHPLLTNCIPLRSWMRCYWPQFFNKATFYACRRWW